MQASIQSRLAGAMREQGMRSLLLADPENFGYVAGPMLPYVKQTPDRAVLALFEPGTDEAACTCWLYPDLAQPAEAQLAKEPSAVCVAVAEDAVGADCLIRRLKESRPDLDGVVGVDFSQTAASVFDALRAAFPGGSITGAPKYRAMEIIDELEHGKRGLYTGSIGYLTLDGERDLNIVIRTALHRDGRYHLGVGGGITSESDLEFEYEETLQKAKAVLEALQ